MQYLRMTRATRTGIGNPFLAIRRVERLLKKVTTALDGAGVPYAVVRGTRFLRGSPV
jgi:hypothetical protein